MLEPFEASPAALDVLDEQVESFGRTVRRAGAVVGEDLAAPPGEGLAERADLGDLVGETPGDRLVQQQRCGVGIVGEVHVPDGLFRQPRAEDFVVGVGEAPCGLPVHHDR